MITTYIATELQRQLQRELSSAYAYYGLYVFFVNKSLNGFATWCKVQAGEELTHADKLLSHLLERNADIDLLDVQAPQSTFSSPLHAFQHALALEEEITHTITQLAHVAEEKRDFLTRSFLNWFLDEQVEEVSQLQTICDRLSLIREETSALLFLDHELGKART
jgi:ferritin